MNHTKQTKIVNFKSFSKIENVVKSQLKGDIHSVLMQLSFLLVSWTNEMSTVTKDDL